MRLPKAPKVDLAKSRTPFLYGRAGGGRSRNVARHERSPRPSGSLGAPGNNFEHDMSLGQSPALSDGQGAPQRPTELTDKDKAARAIQHGCADSASNLKKWAGPFSSKPSLKELRAEVIRRDPTARPTWWGVEKLVAWLMQPGHKPPPDPDPVGLTPAPAPAPAPLPC